MVLTPALQPWLLQPAFDEVLTAYLAELKLARETTCFLLAVAAQCAEGGKIVTGQASWPNPDWVGGREAWGLFGATTLADVRACVMERGFEGSYHTWVELERGSIVDPLRELAGWPRWPIDIYIPFGQRVQSAIRGKWRKAATELRWRMP